MNPVRRYYLFDHYKGVWESGIQWGYGSIEAAEKAAKDLLLTFDEIDSVTIVSLESGYNWAGRRWWLNLCWTNDFREFGRIRDGYMLKDEIWTMPELEIVKTINKH